MFKFLFILVLFFILIGPIIRFAFRFFVMNKIVDEQKKYYQNQQKAARREGDIRVDNPTANKPGRNNSSEGQYIDFEEVK